MSVSLSVNHLNTTVQAAGMCVEKHGAMESIPERVVVETRLSRK